MRRAARFLVAAVAALCAAAASASSEKDFNELAKRFEKAAKNHDDSGVRERRKLILECFDYLDQKACRKLLRDAFEGDKEVDTRATTVQVLGASGDPKDLDLIVSGVAKDKLRAPTIAIGEGLACTAKADAAAISTHAVELAGKAKGDLRFALLEGVGELGDPAAYDALAALPDKAPPPDEHCCRNIALGACGREKAVAELAADAKHANPTVRLGAVVGLAKCGAKEAMAPLTEALRDLDPRVVEAAAAALGAAKHQPASAAMVDALATAPVRVRWVLRAALAAIHGRDFGLDAAAWRSVLEGKKPEPPVVAAGEPKPPQFFGIPVLSDRVVVVLDLGKRMSWQGRLARAQDGITQYLESLDDAASFNVWTCAKFTDHFSKGMTGGAAARGQAATWVRKQLTSGGFNLKAGLQQILDEEHDADTILLATDSMPWGDGGAETAMEAVETFRRANLTRRVKLHIAFVVPGGRLAANEPADEFDDRAAMLELMAKTSGGTFVRIDK